MADIIAISLGSCFGGMYLGFCSSSIYHIMNGKEGKLV